MALTDQEVHCIERACVALASLEGGAWRMVDGPALEDTVRDRPVPEVLVTNGTRTAAIEVKRLAGDDVFQAYREALVSLEKSLAPPSGGYFRLYPNLGFRLPMEQKLRKRIKAEVARLAIGMKPEETRFIKMPRQAVVIRNRPDGNHVWCCHHSINDLLQGIGQRVQGTYFLSDLACPEHKFETDNAKADFCAGMISACAIAEGVGSATADWYDEWALNFMDPDENGVWVASATVGRDVRTAVEQCVDDMIQRGLGKFQERWGDLHVLVLERFEAMMTTDRVRSVIQLYEAEDLKALDLMLMVEDGNVSQVWPLE
jgi:hypothetical protein